MVTQEGLAQALVSALEDSVMIIDTEGRIVLCNPAAARILNGSRVTVPDDFVGRDLEDLPAQVYRENGDPMPFDERPIHLALVRNHPVLRTIMGFRAQGATETLWATVNATPMADGEHVLATYTDITDMHTSELRMRHILDHSLDGLVIVDIEDRIVFANRRLCEMFGRSSTELMGRTMSAFADASEAGVSESKMAARLRGESERYELRLVHAGGRTFIAGIASAPVRDPGGDIEFIVAFVRDITQEREIEQRLARSERRYASLFENVPVGVYSLNMEGTVIASNDELARIARAPDKAQLIGVSSSVFYTDQSEYARFFERIRETGHVEHFDVGMRRLDGTEGWARLTGRLIDGEEPSILGTVDDITEEKKLKEDQEALKTHLREEEHRLHLGMLATKVGHEYNNILHETEQIRQQFERGLHHLASLIQRGKATNRMVLDSNRPIVPELRTVRISSWLRSFINETRHIYAGRARLALNVEQDETHASIDVALMAQVLHNLVKNAVEASMGFADITISAGQVPNERFACVSVKDTGAGMETATLKRVFEPLFTTKPHGLGLGVPHSRNIVHEHHGRMTVESTPGVGTTFHILLPLAEPAVKAVAPPLQGHTGEMPRRVLIVDDEIGIADGMQLSLEFEGIDARCVYEGLHVLDAIETYDPELVILDVGLNDMPGDKVYEQIAARYPRIAVLFSTGHADQKRLGAYLVQPHVGFLQKPYTMDELFAAIRAVWQPAL